MTELTIELSCPFCGKQPEIKEWDKSKLVTENGHICPEVWMIGCDCFFVKKFAHHGTKDDALATWNHRSEYSVKEEK